MADLSEYELLELLQAQSPLNRQRMARLLEELRRLRDQAAERDRAHGEEVGW